MRFNQRFLVLASILGLLGFLSSHSSAVPAAGEFANSKKVTLRLTSAAPPGMEDSLALKDTADYLAKNTDGTVVLSNYFSSSLFGEIPGMEAVQSGTADMGIACTCNMTKMTSSMLFSDLPYIWQTMDNGRSVWNGSVGDAVRKELLAKLKVRAVAFTPSGGGYRILWNGKRQVKVPADVRGLKIRTTATPIENGFWESIGAAPTPVDVAEIYSALQQGVVDAEHLQPVWLNLLKHDEVVKYGTEINAEAVYRVLIISDDAYNRMDAPQKRAFADAMKYFENKAYQYNRELGAKAIAAIKAKGVQIYTPTAAEAAQWRKVGLALWDTPTVKNSVPKATIDEVLALQKK
jgi:TRAP-type C4-dicarboxylate transport system substrate-binding protein